MIDFDIESNGLLPHHNKGEPMDRIHCIVAVDIETGEESRANSNDPSRLEAMIHMIMEADEIVGQNIIDFDIPAIQLIYPWFKPKGKVWDTKVMSQVIYPNLFELDVRAANKKAGSKLPKKLYGWHSQEAWGYRLDCPKDDYAARCKEAGIDPWAAWSQEMEDYCAQDVQSNVVLLQHLLGKNFSAQCLELEHNVARIIARQQRKGVLFDAPAAGSLYAELQQKQVELRDELRLLFPPWEQHVNTLIPKRDNKRLGYKVGVPVEKYKTVEFNPNSGDHVAKVLKERYNWKPKTFTNSGKVEVTDEILKSLDYEGVDKIVEYMIVTKRVSQLAEGTQAWLKNYKPETGRIHGSVNINGAVTGRMTHSKPNMAQVPAARSPYGKECRSLFIVPMNHKMVGCDAEGLELRCLAHYMARYDGGDYGRTVVEGNKEDGTDAHTVNKAAIGIRTRDGAKTWFYAFIYGASDFKLGLIIYEDIPASERKPITKPQLVELGRCSRAALAKRIPALSKIKDNVEMVARQRGWIKGLDGRRIPIRSPHAALNTLLQSAGAIVMKQALVLLDEQLHAQDGIEAETDYEFILNVHDEFQLEVKESVSERVALLAEHSIRHAGEHFDFRCPLAGSSAIGNSWNETH